MLFHFDDEKSTIRLETPGGQKIRLDDDGQMSITIEDKHDNKIVMDEKGFKFTGTKDFIVEVTGDIVINSKAKNVEIKALKDISAKTNLGKFDAQGNIATIKGNVTATLDGGIAEVKGKGMATVKAGMVMIN